YSRRTSHSYVLQIPRRRRCPLFPYTTLFRSCGEFDDPTVGLPSGRWEMRCAGFDGTQLAGGTTAQLQWGSACTISVRWDTNKDGILPEQVTCSRAEDDTDTQNRQMECFSMVGVP